MTWIGRHIWRKAQPVTPDLRAQVGGKAAALIELQQAGFHVPAFVVSPDDLDACIDELGFPLVVRSSATCEDGSLSSFAGQFESYLNIRSREDLHSAIHQCQESLRQDSVREYCQRSGIAPDGLRMHCIVQRMIEPDLAGVLFSINPVSGEDIPVIEAVHGLADELLHGSGSPLPSSDPLVEAHKLALHDLARKVELHFGCPQDIEFAITDDQVHLLQSRPITRITFSNEPEEWTNADFRDGGVSSSVCSPLMWSLYEMVWNRSLKSSLKEVRLFEGDFVASRQFFGRPYWNLSAVKASVARIPGFVEREFDEDLQIQPGYEGDGDRTPWTLGGVLRLIPTVLGIQRYFKNQLQEAEAVLQRGFVSIRARYNQDAVDVEDRLHTLIFEDYLQLETTYFRTIFALSLAKMDFKMSFPDEDYTELVASLPPLSHMAANRRMKQMVETDTFDLQQFVSEFPHHSRHGLDIVHPRWDEDLDFVSELHQHAVESPSSMPPEVSESEFDTRFASHSRSFRRKLHRLRKLVWLREEVRDISSRMYHLIRQHALTLAKRRDLGDDVFFMRADELIADCRDHIADRKLVYRRFRNFEAPTEIGNRFVHDNAFSDAVMKGIGASQGNVTADIHVASNVTEALKARRGTILVCPFTEPSWTPALQKVSGVVTETGGLLSHAAVICREFGIPAVLGIPQATTRLRTGQRLTINGGNGEIHVASES